MICKYCGSKVEPGSRFCMCCGSKIEASAAQVQQPAPVQVQRTVEQAPPTYGDASNYAPAPAQVYDTQSDIYATRAFDTQSPEGEAEQVFDDSADSIYDMPGVSEPYAAPAAKSAKSAAVVGTNGFTVAGFLIALFGFFNLSMSLCALILSIVGLVQRGRTGEKGKGFGIAGIIFSVLSLIISVGLAVVGAVVLTAILDSLDFFDIIDTLRYAF